MRYKNCTKTTQISPDLADERVWKWNVSFSRQNLRENADVRSVCVCVDGEVVAECDGLCRLSARRLFSVDVRWRGRELSRSACSVDHEVASSHQSRRRRRPASTSTWTWRHTSHSVSAATYLSSYRRSLLLLRKRWRTCHCHSFWSHLRTFNLPDVVTLGESLRRRRSFSSRSTGSHNLLQWAVGLLLVGYSVSPNFDFNFR